MDFRRTLPPGTDETAMDFRRLLPEIRWQPRLSPGPAYGSGSRPLQSIHAHTPPVSEPNAPATSPIVRGPTYCDAIPAAAIDTIITLQRIDSMVLNTRPRNSSGVWRSSCALLSTLVTAIPTRENIMNTSAAAYHSAWLNSMYAAPCNR